VPGAFHVNQKQEVPTDGRADESSGAFDAESRRTFQLHLDDRD
jgi:hypothetical protein